MPTPTLRPSRLLLGLLITACCLAVPAAAQYRGLHQVLSQPILAPNQTTVETKVFTASRVPPLRIPADKEAWESQAGEIRRRVLEEVIFRGEAKAWRDADTRVEWLETIPGGPGYRIKKLRYEAVPGLWIPALLYEPENLQGKVPAVLNVNGHDRADGKAADYKQIRCINQAKRGLLALNVEWIGMGQLDTPGNNHTKINQLDLLGAGGIALHYLAQQRALDLLLDHPNADPERVAVTGLSGGGWQTIFLSSLDERVALANPVAGYSSFVTRTQFPSLDLGDSEQTPSDLASVADYTHLTALRAPRPTLLTNNARDTCCFQAEYALPPLLQGAAPIYELYDRKVSLRHHINQDPGHNYGQDNREAFYRMLRDFFYAGSADFPVEEIDVTAELKTGEELETALPADNLDVHQLALAVAKKLPQRTRGTREDLLRVVKAPRYQTVPKLANESAQDGLKIKSWRLHMDNDWIVPALEFEPAQPGGTVVLVADGGRASVAGEVREQVGRGRRVIAVDPLFFGESHVQPKEWLWSILIASLGERPLGIQAGQIAATARWARERYGSAVEVQAVGPRTSLSALIATALEPDAVSGAHLAEAFSSLDEIIERDIEASQAPEMFCFGLREAFALADIEALVAPRPLQVERLGEF